MLKLKFLFWVSLLTTVELFGAGLPSSVIFDKNGSLEIDEIKFSIRISSQNWKESVYNKDWTDVKSNRDPQGLTLSASAKLSGQQEAIEETISPKSPNEFQFKFKAKFTEPGVRNVFGSFAIPAQATTIMVDSKPVELPETYSKQSVYNNAKTKELSFQTSKGTIVTITGTPLNLRIQDNRINPRGNQFSFRFMASPASGETSESTLELGFKVEPLEIQKVSLKKIVNAGFTDEKEGDGKGGWTDQGADNDLRMLKSGTVEFPPFSFEIIDPAQNQGKGALILCSQKRTDFMIDRATLALPTNNAQCINLLHASAWTPKPGELIGTIVAEYADGTSESIPVTSHVDCGNWWNPTTYKNAILAWMDENETAPVGLFASSFALKKPSPTSLRFQANGNDAIWMITSVTLSNRLITLTDDSYNKTLEIRESFQWKPLDYKRTIRMGSPLDFSSNVDAPAGKYGFIRATPEGKLEFENNPGKRIRFFGSNICKGANMPEKEVADQLADYLVYCGYNSMRFHHNDAFLSDKNAPNSTYIDPERLDKFEYLFSKLKEKGIYIISDFHASRRLRKEDQVPYSTVALPRRTMQALGPIIPEAMENWKQFVRNWMTHKNPYTGMTWAEDPAFYAVNLDNEGNIERYWDDTPAITKLYDEAFQKYCKEKNLEYKAPSRKNPTFMRFIDEVQERALEEQMRFVKEELKLKCLITSLNFRNYVSLTLLRSRFDLVDLHCYHDHPRSQPLGKWKKLSKYLQTSSIEAMAMEPIRIAPQRIPGKPFISTEFNFCNPNIYRAEAGPLIGSYAALQDWDALYRYSWSHYPEHLTGIFPAIGFDATNDPLAQFSDRIAIAMFLRGNVEPAKDCYAYTVPQDCYEQNLIEGFQAPFYKLGLITKIGSIPQGSKDAPAGTITISPADSSNPDKLANKEIANPWKQALEDKVATSSTGQIHLNGKKCTFTVNTPNVASITLRKGSLSAGALQVQDASTFQTVAAISLDNQKLEESKSVLIFQLTNLENTGTQYRDSTKKLRMKKGTLPLLIQKGEATIGITSATPCKVEALNCDGEIYGEVKGKLEKGVFSFKADTTLFPGGVMAYHLTR